MPTSVLTVDPVLDRPALERVLAIEEPAYAQDYIALPADPIEEKLASLGGHEIAGNRLYRFVASTAGTDVGAVSFQVPTLDNLTAVSVDLVVHPDCRRQGHGRQLLAWSVEHARRLGRSRLWFQVPAPLDGSEGPAEPLMREVGARPVLEESRRLLDLASTELLPPAPVADGYRVVQWQDRTPDDLVEGVAYLNARMSTDAPNGEMDLEPEVWNAARVRSKEEHGRRTGRLHLLTGVVHEGTGEVAGLTEIAVSQVRPQVAYQWETIVDPRHRGHRLGLALKTWNHQLLAERSPQTRYVNTWNADSNTFMVSVNEQCGFRQMERWRQYQLDL